MKTLAAIEEPSRERIKKELQEISKLLNDGSLAAEKWGQLYAVQQALTWVINPSISAPPCQVVLEGKAITTVDIPVS